MSLKEEILIWTAAIKHYDNDELKEALMNFKKLKKTSRIYYNIAILYRVKNQNDDAIKAFTKATLLDPWFAAAYFFKGVCYCEKEAYNEAVAEFNEALQRLRGNAMIDYSQLGLNLVLESADILLNRAICYYMSKKRQYAQDDLKAAQDVAPNSHACIGMPYNDLETAAFALSEVVEVFCPPNSKITKEEKVDYLGKSKIIAAVEENDTFTGFIGRVQRSNSSPNIKSTGKKNARSMSLEKIQTTLPNSTHHIISNNGQRSPPTPVTPSTPIPTTQGRIKIKFIYLDKAKILMAPEDVNYDELLRKLSKKCNAPIKMYYKKRRISNDSDLDAAIDDGEPVIIHCE